MLNLGDVTHTRNSDRCLSPYLLCCVRSVPSVWLFHVLLCSQNQPVGWMCARCLHCPVLTCVPQQSLTLVELWFFFQKQTLLYEFSSQIHYIKTENARQNRSYSHLKTLGGSYKSNLCSPVFLNIYAQKAYLYIYSVQTRPFGCIIL